MPEVRSNVDVAQRVAVIAHQVECFWYPAGTDSSSSASAADRIRFRPFEAPWNTTFGEYEHFD